MGVNVKDVSFIQIDVEGYDDVVVNALPFDEGLKPDLIIFEYVLLSEVRLGHTLDRLQRTGYEWCFIGQNVVVQLSHLHEQ